MPPKPVPTLQEINNARRTGAVCAIFFIDVVMSCYHKHHAEHITNASEDAAFLSTMTNFHKWPANIAMDVI
jgi:hypothetical protein